MNRNLKSTLLILLILVSSIFVGTAIAQPENKTAVIVGFKDLPDAALIHAHGGQITYQYSIIPAIACQLPTQAIDALQKNPKVAYVEPDYQATALEYGYPTEDWGITQIHAKDVHATDQGDGIKVAVIDTGINEGHTDLAANWKGGYDFVNKDPDPMDDNGHGTHCAGIIAAALDGPEVPTRAVVGVAPKAQIYAYKVLNSQGNGYTSDIIAAINQAVADGVQVISMSLGSSQNDQSLYQACLAANQHGIVVVAAAGNSGNSRFGSTISYPGRYDCVIAVGATDVNDRIASFSSTGPELDVVAPGVNVLSDYKDTNPTDGPNCDTYYMSGTSMAAPHVAGTAALMLHANPNLKPAQIQAILQSTAVDKGTVGFDKYYGYGRIDASAAVAKAAATDTTPPGMVTGLLATADSSNQITLTWNPNTEQDINAYNVYRGTAQNSLTKISTVTATTYTDNNLAGATTYYYQVTAQDKSGNEGLPSTTASAVTQPDMPMIANIDMGLKASSRYTYATATITITNADGIPLSGASISGKWSGATTDSDTGTTNNNGQLTVQSNNVRNARTGTIFTFTINAVTKVGYTLDVLDSELSDNISK